MQAQLDIILPVFLVIGFGYLVTIKGWFEANAIDALVKFTQNFAIPCLLFSAMSEVDLTALMNVRLLASYYVGSVASFFLGFAGARIMFRRNPVDAVAIGFCCLFSNTVLLGLPITERAYGPEVLRYNYAIIALHAPLCYLLGVSAMEIARNRSASAGAMTLRVANAMFRNPFVIGIAIGFVVNVTGLPLPRALASGVDLIVQAALPTALFGLGGILAQYRPEGDWKTVLMICVIALVVHPAIALGAGTALSLERDALRSAVLTASMSSGVNSYVFANMYGAARRVAAASVLISTAASIVTVWLWLIILH